MHTILTPPSPDKVARIKIYAGCVNSTLRHQEYLKGENSYKYDKDAVMNGMYTWGLSWNTGWISEYGLFLVDSGEVGSRKKLCNEHFITRNETSTAVMEFHKNNFNILSDEEINAGIYDLILKGSATHLVASEENIVLATFQNKGLTPEEEYEQAGIRLLPDPGQVVNAYKTRFGCFSCKPDARKSIGVSARYFDYYQDRGDIQPCQVYKDELGYKPYIEKEELCYQNESLSDCKIAAHASSQTTTSLDTLPVKKSKDLSTSLRASLTPFFGA